MRSTAVVGVLLIALALSTLVYQGITYRAAETVADIGLVHATADRQTAFPPPSLLGVVAAVGGVALLVIGRPKDA